MGIFSKESPFDAIVEKVTLETNTKEDWSQILDICDKVASSPQAPKECLRAIIRRLNHQDPHVVIQAATLLDACVSNCGQSFHLEIASREFEQEYRKILNKATEKTLRDKLLGLLEKWATTEFKSAPQLDLIPSFYNKLKASGVIFPNSESPSKTKKSSGSSGHHHHHNHKAKGPSSSNAAQQEEDDLAKAIELSLKETQNTQKTKSLYPQGLGLTGSSGSNGTSSGKAEPRKVRALYDFEAAEDNELTFYAGEIVHVLDDSDANWWQGSNQRGNGLFPSNFVTADLSAEAPKLELGSRKSVQFNDDVEVQTVEMDCEPEVIEIDESKIDRALHLLNEADTNGEIPDPPELAPLEEQVNQMGPLIDAELEKIDRRHAQLTRLGSELVDALNMYHHLMGPQRPPPPMSYDPRLTGIPGQPPHSGYPPPGPHYGPPTTAPPQQMYSPPASAPGQIYSPPSTAPGQIYSPATAQNGQIYAPPTGYLYGPPAQTPPGGQIYPPPGCLYNSPQQPTSQGGQAYPPHGCL